MHKGIKYRFKLTFLLSVIIASKIFNSNVIDCDDNSCLYEELDDDYFGDIDDEKNIIGYNVSREEKNRRNEVADNYIKYYSDYEVNYNYEQFFLTNEEIDNLYNEQNLRLDCEFVNSDTILTLYDKIMKNSLDYVKKYPEYESCFVNNNCNDKKEWSFRYIFSLIFNEHIENSNNNIDEDVCRMQNLKIVFDDNCEDETVVGWYDSDLNVIYLCRNNIMNFINNYLDENDIGCNKNSSVYKDYLWNYYYWVLSHELEHLWHTMCNCVSSELVGRTIFSYSKNKDGFYYVSVFSESSAESVFKNFNNDDNFCGNNMTDDYNYSYTNEIEKESLFMLLSLFNNNVSISDYYSAIGNVDINALLDFFDMNDKYEIYKFYKLLYVVDGIEGRSSLIDKYQRLNGVFVDYNDMYYYRADIGCGYRADIFRSVLSNMIDYTKNNIDYTLKENLLLFNFIKDRIVNNTSYLMFCDGEFEFMYDNKFVKDILILEEEYVNFLSEYYGVSVSIIREIDSIYMKDSSVVLKTLVDEKDIKYYDEDTCNVAFSLFKRFPLLKFIVSSSDYIVGYDRFLSRIDSGMIYDSGKNLKLGR